MLLDKHSTKKPSLRKGEAFGRNTDTHPPHVERKYLGSRHPVPLAVLIANSISRPFPVIPDTQMRKLRLAASRASEGKREGEPSLAEAGGWQM